MKLLAIVFGAVLSALLVGVFVMRHLDKRDAERAEWRGRVSTMVSKLAEPAHIAGVADDSALDDLKDEVQRAAALLEEAPEDERGQLASAIAAAKIMIEAFTEERIKAKAAAEAEAARALAAAKKEAAQLRAKAVEWLAQAERLDRTLRDAEANGGALLIRPIDSLRDDLIRAKAEARALFDRANQLDPQN